MFSRTLVVILTTAAMVLAATAPALPAADAAHIGASGRVVLANSFPAAASRATDLGPAAADAPVKIAIGLAGQDPAGLQATIRAISDPNSPTYRHFLTPTQFDARYGASNATQSQVLAWLARSGFTQTRTFPNHLLVVAQGTNADLQNLLGVSLHHVVLDGAAHASIVAPPTVPAALASDVTGIVGLDDLAHLRPALAGGTPTALPPVRSSTQANPIWMASGDVENGTLVSGGSVWYAFNATAGSFLDLKVSGVTGSCIDLYPPGASTSSASTCADTAALQGELTATAATTGEYEVSVGALGADAYSLSLGIDAPAPAPTTGPVYAAVSPFSPVTSRTFYNDSVPESGAGQTLIIAGAYAWDPSDVTTFDHVFGIAPLPAGSAQICTGAPGSAGCVYDATNSLEVSADVEYQHGTAPDAVVLNYMSATTSLTDFIVDYEVIVTQDAGHSVSTSWGLCDTEQYAFGTLSDNILADAAAIGQSWFAASGDYSVNGCGVVAPEAPGAMYPASSPYVIGVGGTSVPACGGTVSGIAAGEGTCTYTAPAGVPTEVPWSQGGFMMSSAIEARPSWQAGCDVPPTPYRLVPDVALLSDDVLPGYYVEQGGSLLFGVGGTSLAAPQWAGYFAQLNERDGGNGLGLPGPGLYALCGSAAFHQIGGLAYNPTTGLGTPDVGQLLSLYPAGLPDGSASGPTLGSLTGISGQGAVAHAGASTVSPTRYDWYAHAAGVNAEVPAAGPFILP